MEPSDVALLGVFLKFSDSTSNGGNGGVPPTLRLFERLTSNGAAGYTALGYWAKMIAQQYIKSTSVLKEWRSGASPVVPVLFLNEATGREAIRDALLQTGVEVEVWGSPSSGQWQRVKHGSPGNVGDFEGVLFENESGAEVQLSCLGAVLAIEAPGGGVEIGIAFVNQVLRTIHYAQFLDNSQLVHLDAMLTQHMVKEVIYPDNLASAIPNTAQTFIRILESSRATTNRKFAAKEFSYNKNLHDKICNDLGQLLDTPQAAMSVPEQPLALGAVGALLKYWVASTQDDSNRESFTLKVVNAKSFMQLNSATVNALNLVSTGQPEAPAGALPNSVYGFFLNRTSTGMGARTMRQWLLQPLSCVEEIQERLDMVEAMQESAVMRDSLRTSVFRSCTDMDRLNKKLQRGTAGLKDALALNNFTHLIPNIVTILKMYSGRHSKYLQDVYIQPLSDIAGHMENLQLLIESSVETVDREVRVKPEFDDDLLELDAERSVTLKKINKEFARVMVKYGWNDKQLKQEKHASYGHVLRVTRKDDKQVRDNSGKTLITLITVKDGVRFTTDALAALNKDYQGVTKSYEKRQLGLKQKLMETVATYLPLLDDAKELIAQLDVFVAWSTVVVESRHPMVRPTILSAESNILNMVNLRHSLVEVRCGQDFVSNSVKLSGDRNGLIITGPNMGGKSTYMRSVGVAVVLAQAGCFVPCDEATISVRDAILCRVGATDYLSRGVSTFMVEMLEASSIIATATSASLVIIDELGRGTSTYDGFGLAWAIAAQLANESKSLLLFATHYHELTKISEEHNNMFNVHVSARVGGEVSDSIQFLYRLQEGASGKSFGVHVAKIAGIPEAVVAAARARAQELESFEEQREGGGGEGNSGNTPQAPLLSPDDLQYLTAAADKIGAVSGGAVGKEELRQKLLQDERLRAIVGLMN